MKLLFLDSSDPKGCRYSITAGICVDALDLVKVFRNFRKVKSAFAAGPPILEIKWSAQGVFVDGTRIATLTAGQHGNFREQVTEFLVQPDILLFADLLEGLQLADCVAGIINFKVNRDDDDFFKQIEGGFHKSTKGKVESYGVSCIPSSTITTIGNW
ncbi:MAG: hypothetical protein WC891_05380 [Actinomycetota bacterium]